VTPPRLTLIAIVVALIAGVYAADVMLEHAETSELQHDAQGLYDRGAKLLAAGHPDQAVDPLLRACTLERRNRQYQLACAEALTGAHRYDEAASLLDELVRQAPNDGRANLLLARLARARNDFANETAYYHRAIYGVWEGDAATHASESRLEWIHELVNRGDHTLLLGELLELEAGTQDFSVLREVAHDFLVAGTPARAAELYRTLIAAHPDDAGLEEGLGEAEAANGEYALAQRAYVRALRTKPGDLSIRHEMQLASALSEIDPTPRRLPSRVKYQRSLEILRLVHDSLAACGVRPAELADAGQLLNLKKPDTSNEASERALQLAESLWRAHSSSCPAPEVLPAMMQKLSR
jgi:tetratricopeptide (TPR) repeat protein